jgi:hypothetical protein
LLIIKNKKNEKKMFKKFGKEKTLFKNDSFRVKYGTVDASKLNAVYINVESWVEPNEIINFDSKIRTIRNEIITKLKENLDKNFLYENFIVDLDLRSSGLTLNKKSFMFIEVTVYPKKFIKFNSEVLINQATNLALQTIETVKKNNFKFFSKK